jgi:hypothetical protein
VKKILGILAIISMTVAAWAAPPEKYLHVKVDEASKQQSVRVSLPVAVAATMLPAIGSGAVHDGRIQIGSFDVNGVDVMQVLGALNSTPDGVVVTIQQHGRLIHVAKQNGMLIVHVANSEGAGRLVDITVPWAVAAALVSPSTPHQLNLEAAVQALEVSGGKTEVTVANNHQTVSIWVDSQSSM